MNLPKQLIVNADDFGQSKGINEGIITAHEQGIVTSASLMVRYEHANDAAKLSLRNEALSVGLHVDLGEWELKDGEWQMIYQVVKHVDDTNEVEEELLKQLAMFTKITGRNPTHIDSHQHVHQRPELKPVFLRIAAALDIPLRNCGEKIRYNGFFYGQNEDGTTKAENISVAGLNRIINSLEPGITELACHPAFGQDINTMYAKERETELQTLCDPSIKDLLKREMIELVSFKTVRL